MNRQTFIEYTVLIVLFISSYVIVTSPVEVYIGYLGMLVVIPMLGSRFGVPQSLSLTFGILLVSGLVSLTLGENTTGQFFKIFLGVFFSYLFFYYIFGYFQFDTKKLLRLYLKGAYWVSVIGIIQFVGFVLKIGPLYNFKWILNKWGLIYGGNLGIRINSVFPEPTYFATFISPAVFIVIWGLMKSDTRYYSRLHGGIILVTYFLTFSGNAFLALFIMALLLLINYGLFRYALFVVPVAVLVFNLIYNNVEEFRHRYDSTVSVFSTGEFRLGVTHGSTIILYNNYHVALENFVKNPLFGTGLGSHEVAYEKYSLLKAFEGTGISLNSQDANSMFLRIMSETGLFGLGIFFYILFRFYVRKTPNVDEEYWLISNAVLTLIILNLIRQGHYFLNGFPFYVWLYYFNWKAYRNQLELDTKEA